MRKEKDILDNPALKENPFRVSEGYFSDLEERLVEVSLRGKEAEAPGWRLAPYLAYAAALAFLVTAGTFLLKTFTPSTYDTTVEALAYADIYPVTEPDALYYCSEEETVSESDVVEYLIFTGASLEEITLNNE